MITLDRESLFCVLYDVRYYISSGGESRNVSNKKQAETVFTSRCMLNMFLTETEKLPNDLKFLTQSLTQREILRISIHKQLFHLFGCDWFELLKRITPLQRCIAMLCLQAMENSKCANQNEKTAVRNALISGFPEGSTPRLTRGIEMGRSKLDNFPWGWGNLCGSCETRNRSICR